MKIAAAILAFSLLTVGCAVSRPAAPEERIPVEIRSTSPVTVAKAQVLRQNGRVLLSGSLKRPHRIHLPGHVDVLFLGNDGSPIAEKQIKVAGLNSKRHGMEEVRFTASADLNLPTGSSAIFTYHAPPL